MTVLTTLKEFLDKKNVKYAVRTHPVAYTSQEVAAVEHVPGAQLAKVVIIKSNGEFVMAVLPATQRIVLEKMREVLENPGARLATEEEFKGLFPECETGAMPPFGNLYNLAVYVDKTLTETKEIVFRAGTHTDTVHMKYKDFAKLVAPTVVEFSQHI
jgi:Ala-tRNA(Pro) deacylase